MEAYVSKYVQGCDAAWSLLTLLFAALFAFLAFVLAAELDNGDDKEDSQDPEAHGNPDGGWVDPAAWGHRGNEAAG